MPNLPDESQLSEKERMRLAETRLLPSQPPGFDEMDGEASEHVEQIASPTAPYIEDDDVGRRTINIRHRTPPWAYLGSSDDPPSFTDAGSWPSAPQYEPSADSGAVDVEEGEPQPHRSGRRHTDSTATPVNLGFRRGEGDPVLGYEAQDDGPEGVAPTAPTIDEIRAGADAVEDEEDEEGTDEGVEAESDAELDIRPTNTITKASDSSAKKTTKTTKTASLLPA